MVPASDPGALADERTLAALDFEAIRTMLARHTSTERGAAAARAIVPRRGLVAMRSEQAATSEMRAVVAADGFDIPRVPESGDAVARAARGAGLSSEELYALGVALAANDAAVRRIRGSDAPALIARVQAAVPLPQVVGHLTNAIGERGEVLDRASPALARLRKTVASAQEEARERCQTILRSPSFARAIQDTIVTVREGRFVVPVKAEFANQVPGVVHDTSASGHTVFVEPLGALAVNNRLRTARLEEQYEVARILSELSALVGRHAEQIEIDLDILADLDLVLARARLAAAMDASAPAILAEPYIGVHDGRHPLLGARAIPQSLSLDANTQMIVISGPNMGGKTVALKMVGLFVCMAACGMQLPAREGTAIGDFAHVGADIGDEQSIAENASTFSSHLRRLRALLDTAGPRSLVLIDEIAGGTEPAASAALGRALIEFFLERGARGIVTTHSTELKLFAHDRARVDNASVRFNPQSYAPTYELDLGSPGQSLAFPLARALGIDESIVTRAEALLSESERNYDRALAELAELRTQAAAERDELARERAHLLSLQENERRRVEALERERRELGRVAEERLSRALREFAVELERRAAERERAGRARVTAGQASLLAQTLDAVHKDLGLRPGQAERARRDGPVAPPPASVGDTVIVESLGSEGTIADDYGDSVLVAIGSMKTVVPKAGVRVTRRAAPAGAAGGRAKVRGGAASLEAATAARGELDVRGKRFVEAEPIVEKWLDDAMLSGMSSLRLIHGKGTGLLGRGLQEFLRGYPGVAGVRYGNADEGGGGVTILELAGS